MMDTEDEIEIDELCAMFLGRLPPRERLVVSFHLGFEGGHPWTLKEIGAYFKRSVERVRQIEAKGIRRMKHFALHQRVRSPLTGEPLQFYGARERCAMETYRTPIRSAPWIDFEIKKELEYQGIKEVEEFLLLGFQGLQELLGKSCAIEIVRGFKNVYRQELPHFWQHRVHRKR